MSWLRFWKRTPDTEQPSDEAPPAPTRSLPPHIAAQTGTPPPRNGSERHGRRLAELRRRRHAALFDVEQGERATVEDNPWQERIALLTEALDTVNEDTARLADQPPEPFAPLPETPITEIQVDDVEPPRISFAVGDECFVFAEEIDWAERGHQLARGELRRQQGIPSRLVPVTTPPELQEALAAHLAESVFVFATDLRDRALDGEPLPDHPTLADLGRPCPRCGGWRDWRGRCPACTRREAERQRLKREADRLLAERAGEAETQHRLVERLPVARRRLADVERELAALERSTPATRA